MVSGMKCRAQYYTLQTVAVSTTQEFNMFPINYTKHHNSAVSTYVCKLKEFTQNHRQETSYA
jgi:predicted nucleic-acid-binding Zn-ribbon protein